MSIILRKSIYSVEVIAVPVKATKAYRAALVEVSGQLHAPATSPAQEVRWESGLVWTFWRREKSLTPAIIQTSDNPDHSLLTIIPITSLILKKYSTEQYLRPVVVKTIVQKHFVQPVMH